LTISKIFEKPQFPKFPNFTKLFLKFFQIFSKFFQIFSKFFDPKTGFFDSKTQTLHTFFKIFEIYVHFQIISKLFSELKFPNFFPNFFAKILQVQKFRFFPKNFRTLKAELFRNSRKRKVQKIQSNAGPYYYYLNNVIQLPMIN
jgi:hypothetical protein